MNNSTLLLRCAGRVWIGKASTDLNLHVLSPRARVVERFELMCQAIDSDIQNPEGSGRTALEEIRQIEAGETDKIEADGNGWVTHITRDRVWFEGLYSQGEGGAVSFGQYKLAVQTYLRFLADPEHKTIEVPFPEA